MILSHCHTFGVSAIEYQSVSKTDEVGHAGNTGNEVVLGSINVNTTR